MNGDTDITSDTENEAEAREQLANRLADLRRFNALPYGIEFGYDESTGIELSATDKATIEELGDANAYGLSLEVESISPRWATKTYAWVLSTGGPHEEFQITLNSEGAIDSVTFVSLPWFGRVEVPLSYEQRSTVADFVERFLYLEGPTDAELGGGN